MPSSVVADPSPPGGATRPAAPACRRTPPRSSGRSWAPPGRPRAGRVPRRSPPSALPEPAAAALRAVVGAEHVARRRRRPARCAPPGAATSTCSACGRRRLDAPDAVVLPGTAAQVAGGAARLRGRGRRRRAVRRRHERRRRRRPRCAARFAAVVSLDLRRMDRLSASTSSPVTADLRAGVRGPDAERLLARARPHARPLPAVATSTPPSAATPPPVAGQASTGYGRFDELVRRRVELMTPAGPLRLGRGRGHGRRPGLLGLVRRQRGGASASSPR